MFEQKLSRAIFAVVTSNNSTHTSTMVDSFFQSNKKRKRSSRGGGRGGEGSSGPSRMPRASKEQVKTARDEELSSDDGDGGMEAIDDMDFQKDRAPHMLDDAEFVDANETAAEKRVRLARGYLDKVRREVEEQRNVDDYDAAEIDRELIASRLRQEVVSAWHRRWEMLTAGRGRGPYPPFLLCC